MRPLFSWLLEPWNGLWSRLAGDESGPVPPILRPVPPYDGPVFRNPLATFGIALALLATSGIALTALGVLLVALLVLQFLLTEMLGISIEVRPFPA